MADIDLTRSHTMPKDDAKAAVERVAQDLESEYGIPYDWDGDTLRFEGKGADGQIDVSAEEVRVAIDLSFMLRTTLQGTIRERAGKLLDEHLRQEPA